MAVVVKYKDIAIDAKENFNPSVSDQSAYSNILLLKQENVDYKDLSNPCEFYNFALDGNETPLEEDFEQENFGLWSEQFSNENGEFTTPISLVLTSSELFSSVGLSLTFDTDNNYFPTLINIKWYRDNELLEDVDFEPSNAIYFCDKRVDYYNKVEITFYRYCIPFNRLKLRAIDYGLNVEFSGGQLLNAKMIQEVDPMSTQISINTFDFTLNKREDVEYSFQRKQPMSVYFNGNLLATHFVRTAKRKSKYGYNIETEDYIGLLDSIYFYGGIYSNKNALEIIEDIFITAKIPYEIQGDFDVITVSGYIPYSTCRNALMQVAFAIGAVVDTSNSNKVIIKRLSEEVRQTIPLLRIMQGQNFERGTNVSAVEVSAHNYRPITDTLEVYRAEDSGTGENIFVSFNEPLHDLSITNGEIIESGTNYAIITANVGCVLAGQKYEHTSTVKSVKNPLLLRTDIENIIAIEKATLVSKDNIDFVLQRCYNYYVKTQTMNAKIIESRRLTGEGEIVYDQRTTVGDIAEFETEYLGVLRGQITKQTFNLIGGSIVKNSTVKILE